MGNLPEFKFCPTKKLSLKIFIDLFIIGPGVKFSDLGANQL